MSQVLLEEETEELEIKRFKLHGLNWLKMDEHGWNLMVFGLNIIGPHSPLTALEGLQTPAGCEVEGLRTAAQRAAPGPFRRI